MQIRLGVPKFRMDLRVIAARRKPGRGKVRAPQSRAAANGSAAQADGKCHRDESCRETGRGETR